MINSQLGINFNGHELIDCYPLGDWFDRPKEGGQHPVIQSLSGLWKRIDERACTREDSIAMVSVPSPYASW